MICYEVLLRFWEKVVIDLFQLEYKDYIVIVDYYLNFFEVDQLFIKIVKVVICKVKVYFVRYGILD